MAWWRCSCLIPGQSRHDLQVVYDLLGRHRGQLTHILSCILFRQIRDLQHRVLGIDALVMADLV